jgi:replication factor A1
MQVLSSEAMEDGGFRMVLSDGAQSIHAMSSVNREPLHLVRVERAELIEGQVPLTVEVQLAHVGRSRAIIGTPVPPFHASASNHSVGNPTPLMETPAAAGAAAAPDDVQYASSDGTNHEALGANAERGEEVTESEDRVGTRTAGVLAVGSHGISDLRPGMTGWSVVARVSGKSEALSFEKWGRRSQRFSFDLVDAAGGKIRVMAWHREVETFYDVVREGAVYQLENATVKLMNDAARRFNKDARHSCELTLHEGSRLTEQPEDGRIPLDQFRFRKLDGLAEAKANQETVDILAIVAECGPIVAHVTKQGKQMSKRIMWLRDDTMCEIEATLWGQPAEAAQEPLFTANPVVLLRSLTVSDWNGLSLNMNFSGSIRVSPPMPEATALSAWWASVPADTRERGFQPLGRGRQVHGTLEDIQRLNIGRPGYPDVIAVRVIATKLGPYDEKRPPWYRSCPNLTASRFAKKNPGRPASAAGAQGDQQQRQGQVCGRKMTTINGKWACDVCNRAGLNDDEAPLRYVLHVSIADATGSVRVTAFHEVASQLVGASPEVLLAKGHHDATRHLDGPPLFSYWNLRLKVSHAQRTEIHAIAASPIDFSLPHP